MSKWEDFCTPIQASAIKKGALAILKERPCKINDVSVSKTGKHGHAKCHFIGTDVFTGKKYEDICPSTHNMWQPVLERVEYDLIDIDEDNYLTLMDESGSQKEDLQLPDGEIGQKIRELFDNDETVSVTVLTWGNIEEAIVDFKKISD